MEEGVGGGGVRVNVVVNDMNRSAGGDSSLDSGDERKHLRAMRTRFGNCGIVVATDENRTFEGQLGIGRDETGWIRDRCIDQVKPDRHSGVRVRILIDGSTGKFPADRAQRPLCIRVHAVRTQDDFLGTGRESNCCLNAENQRQEPLGQGVHF